VVKVDDYEISPLSVLYKGLHFILQTKTYRRAASNYIADYSCNTTNATLDATGSGPDPQVSRGSITGRWSKRLMTPGH